MTMTGPELEQLLYSPQYMMEDETYVISSIARLTALTRLDLQLKDIHPSEDYRVLQKLGVLELSLVECAGMAEALIEPGAFPSLQKLHIQDTRTEEQNEDEETVQKLGSLAPVSGCGRLERAVFNLPHLLEVSGVGKLFYHLPQGWSVESEDDYSEYEEDGYCLSASALHVWRKD